MVAQPNSGDLEDMNTTLNANTGTCSDNSVGNGSNAHWSGSERHDRHEDFDFKDSSVPQSRDLEIVNNISMMENVSSAQGTSCFV